MEKLIKIQSELKAPKNQKNNFANYYYRSCEDILEALKPLLSENNCVVTLNDEICEIANLIYTKATATIKDNDTKETISVSANAGIETNKKGMDLPQTFGTSSSYARKYALNALFLIDDNKDNDTDEHRAIVTNTPINQSTFKKSEPKNVQKKPLIILDKDKNMTADWQNIVKKISEKTITLDKIKEHYVLTAEIETKLNELIK